MKAIRVLDGTPQLAEVDDATGEGVRVKIVSSSICGSDLHLIDLGVAEGWILGHEFAGTTPDGTVVAIEPTVGCGSCAHCLQGHEAHCGDGFQTLGIGMDGGMAEEIVVPASMLVEVPSGLDVSVASLVEPVAVGLHGVNRARITGDDRVLVLGAGPIGLAVAAVLGARGVDCDIAARHPHQQEAAERLGANVVDGAATTGAGYDAVMEAVGTSESMAQSIAALAPMGRIGLVGSLWEPMTIDMMLCMKEAEIIPAMTYSGTGDDREFAHAAAIVAEHPEIAETLISHRFPLDAPAEAFAAARDRKGGAIKVVFDI